MGGGVGCLPIVFENIFIFFEVFFFLVCPAQWQYTCSLHKVCIQNRYHQKASAQRTKANNIDITG